MKKALLSVTLLIACRGFAQCPFMATLTSTGNCPGATLTVGAPNTLSQIAWYNGSSLLSTVNVPPVSSGITVAGGDGAGNAANQLNYPFGVFVDGSGNVYVADRFNNRIQKWTPGATNGVTVAGGNGSGSAANQLNSPTGVAVDGNGSIYVSDMVNNRVQKFPPGSTVLTAGTTVAGGNGYGNAANQLTWPWFLFVDAPGNLYVVDQNNERVQKFPPGSTSATPGVTVAVSNWGVPVGLFVDAAGDVYISEGDDRVSKWAPGATTGVIVAGGNGPGPAANQLDAPGGIYVDGNGNVYVADLQNSRIQKWAPGATSGITVAGGNGPGPAADQLSGPEGVYVDGNGNIYATDLGKNSVQKWAAQPVIDTTYIVAAPGTYTAVVTNTGSCSSSATTNAVIVDPLVQPAISITADHTDICAGAPVAFSATALNEGSAPVYQWQVNGVDAGINNPVFTNNNPTDGDIVSCSLTSNAICAVTAMATSNSIPVTVHAVLTPVLSVSATITTLCAGDPVRFTATVTNGGTDPVYQWEVDGVPAGSNLPDYTNNNFANGDVVICRYAGNAGCATASSDPISLTVNDTPHVDNGQAIALPEGQSVTLGLLVNGEISSYLWQPGTALSDSTIADPVASPTKTILYTLTAATAAGCTASGNVKVNVFTQLRIPNAFTPNGDGRNDIFYIPGGPDGSRIRDLSIYNRWGQRIFEVQDVMPNDPAMGWNGNFKGAPAPAGGYVYVATIRFADGTQQVFQGTLMLVR